MPCVAVDVVDTVKVGLPGASCLGPVWFCNFRAVVGTSLVPCKRGMIFVSGPVSGVAWDVEVMVTADADDFT